MTARNRRLMNMGKVGTPLLSLAQQLDVRGQDRRKKSKRELGKVFSIRECVKRAQLLAGCATPPQKMKPRRGHLLQTFFFPG